MENTQALQKSHENNRYNKNSMFRKACRSILGSPTGTLGLILTIVSIIVAVAAPFIAPYESSQVDMVARFAPPVWLPKSIDGHLLGTDYLGRDILSRILYGSQISIVVGICSVAFASVLGSAVGLVSGYFGGKLDAFIMRFVDAFRTIPTILMNLVIMMIMGPGLFTVIFSIGVTTWTQYARIIRGEVLSVRQREYVLSARAIGAKNSRIMLTDILPNVSSTLIVTCTNSVAQAIITESSLSFLGLGISAPQVTWGSILSDGRNYVSTAWWISTFPGLAICFTVMGIMFFGDWLRDFLDPRINANA